MVWEIRQLVLFVHILLGIIWVGGVLFIGWGVFPAARNLVYQVQREFFLQLMRFTHWIFTGVGIAVIFTGILLGTVLGPIQSWEALWNTPYGNKWFTALVIGIFTLIWGVVFGYRQSMKVFSNVTLWETAAAGDSKMLNRTFFKIALIESVEVIGFMVLLYLMVSL